MDTAGDKGMAEKRISIIRIVWGIAALLVLLWTCGVPARGAEIAAGRIAVTSVLIQNGNVVVTTSGQTVPDDGLYHLYAQMPYENGVQGTEVATALAGNGATFLFPLCEGTANSHLYQKFTVVCILQGQATEVSNAMYITNPEAAATVAATRYDISKKGLLPDAAMIETDMDALKEIGIHQITYNVNLGSLLTNGTVPYTYNGKVYYLNADVIGSLDRVVPRANVRQIQVTLILLNNRTSDTSLIHPMSRGYTGAQYYAFNTTDAAGCERLAAAASYLANRYNGGEPGTVDNWIIENEVNARATWYYMSASAGLTGLVRAYADEVRICYNAIKVQNANARIFISLDHQYAESENASQYYAGRKFLEAFNTLVSSEGNYDWNVAIHPYNADMTDPVAWAVSARVTDAQCSPYITMQNVHLVTDLLQRLAFKTSSGEVRRTFVSEVGYNGAGNQAAQAASVVYGYLQCLYNPYIDGYVYCRQTDDAAELSQSLALGLQSAGHAARTAWSFYTNADDEGVQAQVAAIIGVPSIENVIPYMLYDPDYAAAQHQKQLALEYTKTAYMRDELELP